MSDRFQVITHPDGTVYIADGLEIVAVCVHDEWNGAGVANELCQLLNLGNNYKVYEMDRITPV